MGEKLGTPTGQTGGKYEAHPPADKSKVAKALGKTAIDAAKKK